MGDLKDKMKGLMKKVNSPFSSPSGKFKGQGRVLGSAPSSSSSSSATATATTTNSSPRPPPPTRSVPHPTPTTTPVRQSAVRPAAPNPSDRDPPAGFDPFDPLITSSRRSVNGCSLAVFECPVCARAFPSEDDVAAHLDTCLAPDVATSEVAGSVAAFMSGEPADGSVEVVLRLLRNVVREPGNAKFRNIRMGNPKIKEAVGDVKGGLELLECVGFQLREDGGEVWAMMETPLEEQIALMKESVFLLERWKPEDPKPAVASAAVESRPEPKMIDRQVRVFFSVPEDVAAKIDLPDSFYNLSAEEIKREADMRKKKLAESQLLIPKSFREKQAMAARKKYKLTVIRIQFPDGVVLQGVFLPWEPTSVLYEFVSSALKEASLEFELLCPAVPKPRVIPHSLVTGDRPPTLEEEDLVPSALVKFKPTETDSIVFTGLCNELLEASEPLTTATTLI